MVRAPAIARCGRTGAEPWCGVPLAILESKRQGRDVRLFFFPVLALFRWRCDSRALCNPSSSAEVAAWLPYVIVFFGRAVARTHLKPA